MSLGAKQLQEYDPFELNFQNMMHEIINSPSDAAKNEASMIQMLS